MAKPTRKNARSGYAEVWLEDEQLGYVLRVHANWQRAPVRVRTEVWEAFDMADMPIFEEQTFVPKVWGGNAQVMPKPKTWSTQKAAIKGLAQHLQKRVNA